MVGCGEDMMQCGAEPLVSKRVYRQTWDLAGNAHPEFGVRDRRLVGCRGLGLGLKLWRSDKVGS